MAFGRDLKACLLMAVILLAPLVARGETPVQAGSQEAALDESEATGLLNRDRLTGAWGGSRAELEARGIKPGLLEQSEWWGNISGGLRRGSEYNGLTTASLNLDLERLWGWDKSTFFVDVFQIHGHGPSLNLTGNLQTVSNIEATRATKLYNIWLEKQMFADRLNVRIGQEGANDEMMLSQYAAFFLNSSFGYPALLALDLPSGGPNYPIAAPMVRAKYALDDQITLVGALFNGDPAGPGTGDPQLRDRTGTEFRVNDGALGFAELWYSTDFSDEARHLPGTYKLGALYHSGSFADQRFDDQRRSLADPAGTAVARRHHGDRAAYAVFDQLVFPTGGGEDAGIGIFGLLMVSPDDRNLSDLFIHGGLHWRAPVSGRPDDVAGLAFAHVGIGDAARSSYGDIARFGGHHSTIRHSETIVELTYLFQLAPWLSVQPDIQYVINPSAGIPTLVDRSNPTILHDALIAGVRAGITF